MHGLEGSPRLPNFVPRLAWQAFWSGAAGMLSGAACTRYSDPTSVQVVVVAGGAAAMGNGAGCLNVVLLVCLFV